MTKKLWLIAIVLIGAILFDTTNLQAIPTILIVIGTFLLMFAPLISYMIKYE